MKEVDCKMGERSEVKSENAHNVILSYGDTIYFVNRVNVKMQEGVDALKAIFHARRANDGQLQDLEIEINRETYNMLVEYAKLDSGDLILVLHIEGKESKWCLMSENWLKKQSGKKSKTFYIV
ncbi:MAG: hypothetical protein NWF09_03075 [Candidatus Bathyarchaeota archaeon]|nr:hypothetical protein [Candidatus Bathyarchaeota archaeon]